MLPTFWTRTLPQKCAGRLHCWRRKGNFMGGNVCIPVRYAVFVKVEPYLELPEQMKYASLAEAASHLMQVLNDPESITG